MLLFLYCCWSFISKVLSVDIRLISKNFPIRVISLSVILIASTPSKNKPTCYNKKTSVFKKVINPYNLHKKDISLTIFFSQYWSIGLLLAVCKNSTINKLLKTCIVPFVLMFCMLGSLFDSSLAPEAQRCNPTVFLEYCVDALFALLFRKNWVLVNIFM